MKIIQNRLVSPSHIVDGSQSLPFQCMASSKAKPTTNINRPIGRNFGENLRTGTSPENSAIYNPKHIMIVDGRILTSKALDAAEGEDGTVRKETLKRRMPIPPIILPNFCVAESFRNCSPKDTNTKPKGAQSRSATLSSFSMCVFYPARFMNMAVNLLFVALFEVESCYDSNKYPTMVAKLFR